MEEPSPSVQDELDHNAHRPTLAANTLSAEGRVGLVAPYGRDAELIRSRLQQIGAQADTYSSLAELCEQLVLGHLDALVITTEALNPVALRRLKDALLRQPSWSDVPLIVLASRGQSAERVLAYLSTIYLERSLTVLERPLPSATLLSTVRLALRARQRQHDVAALLKRLEKANATLEERVEARTDEVRRLARDLTMAEQSERHRIASLLHDHLQQLLYSLQIKIEVARSALAPRSSPALAALDGTQDIIADAIDATRTLTVDLSPPVLDGEGLRVVFNWLASHMTDLYGLEVSVEGDCVIAEEHLRVLLYQMGRELLFNVVKHASVTYATVRIEETEENCLIHVEDEGAGFDPESVEPGTQEEGGFGLHSIRERLGLLGGRLDLSSSRGVGTQATIVAPSVLKKQRE